MLHRLGVEMRWDVSTKAGKPGSPRGESREFLQYGEAKAIAAVIAQREGVDSEVIFSDAMHVAVALALENAGMPYTGPNAAWMFEHVTPAEVREVLAFRRDHSRDYEFLPKARIIESLSASQREAANTVATSLTRAELDAFFFGKSWGTA